MKRNKDMATVLFSFNKSIYYKKCYLLFKLYPISYRDIRFKEVNEAHSVLSNKSKKARSWSNPESAIKIQSPERDHDQISNFKIRSWSDHGLWSIHKVPWSDPKIGIVTWLQVRDRDPIMKLGLWTKQLQDGDCNPNARSPLQSNPETRIRIILRFQSHRWSVG